MLSDISQTQKRKYYVIPLMRDPEQSNPETGRVWWVPGLEGGGSCCLMGTEFPLYKIKMF